MLDPLKLAAAAAELGIAHFGRRESWSTGSIILVAVGTASAVAGGAFAIAALLLYLIPLLGGAGAALAVAVSLIAVSCLTMLSSHYLARRARSRQQLAQPDLRALALGAETFIRDNKALTLAGAFVAGLLAGDEQSRPRVYPD